MFRGSGSGARRSSRPFVLKLVALSGAIGCVSLVGASSASAACTPPACLPLTFHNVVLDTKALGGVAVVKPSGAPLQVNATVTGGTAPNFTYAIKPGDWTFPTYNFTKPLPGTITVNPKNGTTPTGTVNITTGATTLAINLEATINITGVGGCTVDTGTLNMSTSNTQPLLSQPFSNGLTGLESGAGSIGVGWSSLPAPAGTACSVISTDLAGAGGIWMSGSITPPSMKTTVGKLKTLKAGKSETVKVTVKNSGQAPSGKETVCLKVPKGIKGGGCKAIANVAGGKSSVVSFKVKATKKKTKKYTLKLTVKPTATGLLPANGVVTPQNITLKVKK